MFDPRRSLPRMIVGLVSILAAVTATQAQCAFDWLLGEGHPGVTGDDPVWDLLPWDPDGAGPRPPLLIVAGGFLGVGNFASGGIASWNGNKWIPVGSGFNSQVFALAVFNGDLIAAGNFTAAGSTPANFVARWDGSAWHPLSTGLNGSVRALAVYNGQLYAGGFFTQAGGSTARGIARWNGTTWQSLGGAVNTVVTALGVFNGKLIVGGTLTAGIPATRIASWNGSTWQSLDGSSAERITSIEAFTVYKNELIAGAVFSAALGGGYLRRVGRWDGTAWRNLGTGTGIDDFVYTMTVYRGDLYVGGALTSAGGMQAFRMARFNGSTWAPVPPGPGIPARQTMTLAVFGDDLIAGGLSSNAEGSQTSEIGRFDGTSWHYMGGGVDFGVSAVASYHGDLFIGGFFGQAGEVPSSAIARRHDGNWDNLDGGLGGDCCNGSIETVQSMVVYRDMLLVSGGFTEGSGGPLRGVARWTGQNWKEFGTVRAIHLMVDGDNLYGTTGSGLTVSVVRWDPDAQAWVSLGIPHPRFATTTLGVYQGELIAGGIAFDGAPASVFRWDGAAWHPMGAPFGLNSVKRLVVYNGELLAGGFMQGGVVRWTGSSWAMVGAGGLFGDAVNDLEVYNGMVFAAGQQLSFDGGSTFTNIGQWNGFSWSALGAGTNDAVLALGLHNKDLIAGGWFITAGGKPNGYFATFGAICP